MKSVGGYKGQRGKKEGARRQIEETAGTAIALFDG